MYKWKTKRLTLPTAFYTKTVTRLLKGLTTCDDEETTYLIFNKVEAIGFFRHKKVDASKSLWYCDKSDYSLRPYSVRASALMRFCHSDSRISLSLKLEKQRSDCCCDKISSVCASPHKLKFAIAFTIASHFMWQRKHENDYERRALGDKNCSDFDCEGIKHQLWKWSLSD